MEVTEPARIGQRTEGLSWSRTAPNRKLGAPMPGDRQLLRLERSLIERLYATVDFTSNAVNRPSRGNFISRRSYHCQASYISIHTSSLALSDSGLRTLLRTLRRRTGIPRKELRARFTSGKWVFVTCAGLISLSGTTYEIVLEKCDEERKRKAKTIFSKVRGIMWGIRLSPLFSEDVNPGGNQSLLCRRVNQSLAKPGV